MHRTKRDMIDYNYIILTFTLYSAIFPLGTAGGFQVRWAAPAVRLPAARSCTGEPGAAGRVR